MDASPQQANAPFSGVAALLQGSGFPFVGTLVDNVRVGSFIPRLKQVINNNAETTVAVASGKPPSGYIPIAFYGVTAATTIIAGTSTWNDGNIYLRAIGNGTAAVTVSLLIF